ncbi:hypothetical protein TRFO_22927 [Tritrichomonas foetus]|uniref:Uncharacterized protein n=1 Tax=Tritrichomonas foetus TaxID=1144522 RepID=A0A1J4KGQ6_9EUKA|nr:hypothetical protein TRFO_22927 [Tritrichomonas foetus]|eukprot:OHT08509.1 hypothetical protein TRFO_22927 [Tritrichomonas foetus]
MIEEEIELTLILDEKVRHKVLVPKKAPVSTLSNILHDSLLGYSPSTATGQNKGQLQGEITNSLQTCFVHDGRILQPSLSFAFYHISDCATVYAIPHSNLCSHQHSSKSKPTNIHSKSCILSKKKLSRLYPIYHYHLSKHGNLSNFGYSHLTNYSNFNICTICGKLEYVNICNVCRFCCRQNHNIGDGNNFEVDVNNKLEECKIRDKRFNMISKSKRFNIAMQKRILNSIECFSNDDKRERTNDYTNIPTNGCINNQPLPIAWK